MATLKIPEEKRSITERKDVQEYLAGIGIEYERWEPGVVPADASPEQILDAHSEQIAELKARGGYVTADVIDVKPQTPGLEAMLAKFNIEHWHDEDELRHIIARRGLFHVQAQQVPVDAIEPDGRDL